MEEEYTELANDGYKQAQDEKQKEVKSLQLSE